MDPAELESNAKAYAALWDLSLNLRTPLGEGTDGKVWKSSAGTAVKAVEREVGYYNERDSYLRLAEYGLTRKIDGFWVPRLVGYHDELRVIEMELIGDPPYIIDFAKVRIDRPPDFSKETMREAEEKCEELFQHHWPEVRMLLATLESYGIYYLDTRPWNIVFGDLGARGDAAFCRKERAPISATITGPASPRPPRLLPTLQDRCTTNC